MDWTSTKALVTGAGGFIGSRLAARLMELGAEVTAFCRYTSSGKPGLLELLPREQRPEVVLGDLRDCDAVRDAAKGKDVVFHLGALIAIPYSYLHMREVVETNVLGTLNVLVAAREAGARVVHTSTSEVYGTAQTVPISEAHPTVGQSPYSASKIGADKLAESFHLSFAVPVATVRPFNTYGPGQSARAFIPSCIAQALVRREIRIGHTEPTRDLTYVSDTVEGFIAAVECDRAWGQTINLGTGTEISMGDLVARIRDLIDPSLPIIAEDERKRPEASEVWRLVSDNRRAREVMGWQPTVSLDDGLRETIAWITDHLDLYDPWRYAV
jgi:NAD dependent epimerase/dehydratase